ncbi:MAG: ABC transporter permease [Armatimonadetes bacterium]|nr:ABC transporter permease [Armatimonadota bacterium]
MTTQIRLELFKLARKGRSYLGFGALIAIVGLVILGFRLGPPPFEASFAQGFVMVGSYLNAGFVAWFLLRVMLQFFLPLFACVVTGDLISGEAADGTLRTILSRPVGRRNLLASKFAVSLFYVIVLTFFLGVASYAAGAIFLGRGMLVTFQEGTMLGAQGIYIYAEPEGLARLAAAYAFASLGVLSVATIAFFLSTLVANSLGAIGGAMMTMILFQILGVFDYFKPIHPYLFTTHMSAWTGLFAEPVPWGEIWKSLGTLSVYVAAFFTAGMAVFVRKDVLS